MPKRVTPSQRARFEKLINQEGRSVRSAAFAVGVSTAWAYHHARALDADKKKRAVQRDAEGLNGPVPYDQLCTEARLAYDDFEYFRLRYFGHVSMPWQVEAGQQIIASLESPVREYTVENVPPGGGKTTLMHDIAAFATVRNRAIRGLMGSGTQSKANKMLNRLRRSLERSRPERADEKMAALGLSVDAQATLAADYGLFRPLDSAEPWRADALMVVQHNFDIASDKEYTWMAYGLEVDYLGDRLDLILWDDAQTPRDITTVEKIEAARRNYDQIAETRLEPGGALFLVGQRVDANDLYRHCLDKVVLPDDDESLDELEAMTDSQQEAAYDDMPRKYRHIVYKAHDDERCVNDHRSTAKPYPDGCLLDPVRLPWRELRSLKHQDPITYSVFYQQEDNNLRDSLVKKVWVSGGTDPDTGTQHWTCWDNNRALNQIPQGLKGPKFHFATVDPSPTRFWAIQSWLYTPEAEQQVFLLDLHKGKLRADEVLEWRANEGMFVGLMQDWQERSVAMGSPITHWIIERNGAQRFLLQYEFVRRWCSLWNTQIVPHDTFSANKHDPDYGVYVLREPWRTSRVRLPGLGQEARLASMKLIDEVQRYPHGYTDDQVMAMWFLFSHLPRLAVVQDTHPQARPSWVDTLPDARKLTVVR